MAQKTYLEQLGNIPDIRLAKKVGVHRNTIKKWKTEGNWDALVAQTQQSVDKKLTDAAADKIAKHADDIFNEIFTNLKLLSLATRKKILVEDEKGRPVLGPDGQPKINPNLSAASIRSLFGSMEAYQKMVRLHVGQSTENNRVTGEVATTSCRDDVFDQRVEEIMQSGDAAAQADLAELMKNYQKVMHKRG